MADHRRLRHRTATFVILQVALVSASANEPEPEDAPVTTQPTRSDAFTDWLQSPTMTGDWGGVRSKLARNGVQLNLYYNTTTGFLLHGGIEPDNVHRNSGTVDLLLRLDFDKMDLIPGGRMLVFAKGHYSRNINPKVGALSDPYDDADGDKSIYIDDLHYEQDLLDGRVQLRFGYLDQQLILDRNAYANSEDIQFMSTYLDNNNAIIPLTIGLGATLFVHPTDFWTLIVGAADSRGQPYHTGFDTTFHDSPTFFGYLENDFRISPKGPNGELPGNYRFGVFYDPRSKQVFEELGEDEPAEFETGDVGFYLSFDQMIYRELPDDDQGLGLFFRYGYRHGDVNRIEQFWSVGGQYEGLLPGRDDDVLGLGVYSASASDQYRREVDPDFLRETGYELYYRIQLTPWMALTPDFQYINNPGGLQSVDDAVVIGLRLRFSL